LVPGSTAAAVEERRRGGGRRMSDHRVRVRRGQKEAVVVAAAEEERKRPQVSISPAGAVVRDGRRAGDGWVGDKRRVGFLGRASRRTFGDGHRGVSSVRNLASMI
jgi:hypothetical protein